MSRINHTLSHHPIRNSMPDQPCVLHAQTARSAFSLIELMVAIAILLVLVTISASAIMKWFEKAKVAVASAQTMSICNAVLAYNHAFGHMPLNPNILGTSDYYFPRAYTNDNWVVPEYVAIFDRLSGSNALNKSYLELEIGPNSYPVDPWRQPYLLVLDVDNDGSLATMRSNLVMTVLLANTDIRYTYPTNWVAYSFSGSKCLAQSAGPDGVYAELKPGTSSGQNSLLNDDIFGIAK